MAAQADDEDDYEVIYANSPLYWSLIDAGLENVGGHDICEREPPSSQEQGQTSSVPQNFKINRQDGCRVSDSDAKHSYWRWLTLPGIHRALDVESKRKTFKSLICSTLLNEEDVSFLSSLQENQQWSVASSSPVNASGLSRTLWCFLLLAVSSIVTSLLASAFGLGVWISVVANTVAALCLPVLFYQAAAFAAHKHARNKHKGFLLVVDELLSALSKNMEVLSKSIRFIQESELVARGFTFVGNMSTSRVLKEMQMAAQQRQCPALRQQVFSTAKAQFMLFRQSFAQLVALCPVGLEVSGVMRYCSEIPLSQYPDVIQLDLTDHDSLPKLMEMTDSFSIDILKSMHELNRIHVSEFIRRLAVSFLVDQEASQFSPLQYLLSTMTRDLSSLQKDLQSCLDAHRHSSVSSVMRDPRTVEWQPVSAASQLQQLHQAVHSLELHLLAALRRVQDIGQTVEKEIEESASPENSEPTTQAEEIEASQREQWSSLLSVVRAELSACSGCLEEGVHHLETKTSTGGECAIPKVSQGQPEKKAEGAKVVKISAKDDPIIQDEVFEGYSEPQEYGARGDGADITSAEEEAWRKKRRELKMCLSELGAIIAVRAADRQEREHRAIERMRKQTHKDTDGQEKENKLSVNEGENVEDAVDAERQDEEDANLCHPLTHSFHVFFKRGGNVSEADSALTDNKGTENMYTGTTNMTNTHPDFSENFGLPTDTHQTVDAQHDFDLPMLPSTQSSGGQYSTKKVEGHTETHRSAMCEESDTVQETNVHDADSWESDKQTGTTKIHASELQKSDTEMCTSAETSEESVVSAASEQTTASETPLVNPLVLTPPSAQLHGGRCEHKRVSASEISGSRFGITTAFSENGSDTDQRLNSPEVSAQDDTNLEIQPKCDFDSEDSDSDSDQSIAHTGISPLSPIPPATQLSGGRYRARRVKRHPQYRSKPESVEEHLSLPAAPSPFSFSVASMVASRARDMTRTVDTFGDSSSEEGESLENS